jgi:hypothetical protein
MSTNKSELFETQDRLSQLCKDYSPIISTLVQLDLYQAYWIIILSPSWIMHLSVLKFYNSEKVKGKRTNVTNIALLNGFGMIRTEVIILTF